MCYPIGRLERNVCGRIRAAVNCLFIRTSGDEPYSLFDLGAVLPPDCLGALAVLLVPWILLAYGLDYPWLSGVCCCIGQ